MRYLGLSLIIILTWFPLLLVAESKCLVQLATVISVQGVVEKKSKDENFWREVKSGSPLCADEAIRTQKHSKATVEIINQTIITLDQDTTLFLPKGKEKSVYDTLIDLLNGKVFFRSRELHRIKINTPFINAVHQGTEFMVDVTPNKATVMVFDGKVAADNEFGKVNIKKGQQAIALRGQAPQVKAIRIRPQDAVQWLLYYPPILDQHVIDKEQLEAGSSDALNHQAGKLLYLGRIDEARQVISEAKLLEPDNANSLALESVIAVAKNHSNQAIELATRAVEQEPKSVAAKIALSYALQAQFNLDEALITMEKAVRLKPRHALAWARLAELQLSLGDHKSALISAQKAEQLNPELARTQIVLGFADLAHAEIKNAQQAFEQAINLDTNDPLARLGLGLAKIRQGKTSTGVRDMEAAASLDPDSGIFRSYLGKTYYELKNNDYAATELALGKELDSNDSTPWFYDAIVKQTTNRPVEALHDMQKAIELNDNRAVYRSNLLLDDDLAARSASLGRIYNDLGFQQRGLVEGWKSVNTSPSNYSAHRLLADNYASLRSHETARVSELLQSQLLQPANITPIQPRLAESNILVLDGLGPSTSSFNEFNPLFAKNRLTLQASGIVGGNNTFGNEVVQSGLRNNFSYSLGQFHYQTDGFRTNNDLDQNIYSGFMQYQFTPDFSVQVEGRYNEFESGDLALRFRPVQNSREKRIQRQTYSGRLGFHYQPIKNNHLLASVTYNDTDHQDKEAANSNRIQNQNYTAEGQYLFESDRVNVVVGGGHFQNDGQMKIILPPGSFALNQFSSDIADNISILEGFDVKHLNQDQDHSNGYIYTSTKLRQSLIATLGLSFDSYRGTSFNRSQLNPKIGISWQILPSTLVRAAAFQTVKRPFSSNQTIEPTQVAGFNQFFDDLDGAKTRRYGFAVDHQFNSSMFAGLETSIREVDYPINVFGALSAFAKELTDREQLYRTYFLWTFNQSLALKAAYSYEHTKRSPDANQPVRPTKIKTHRLPLTLNYFHSNGFFAKLGATFVEQNVTYQNEVFNASQPGNDHFWIIDTSIGYRLPKRWGIATFGVKNLFNEKFHFEDFNSQKGEPVAAQFQPDRVLFGQLTLSF